MSKKHRNWLERGERNKIILLGAGTKGGSGKSLKLANIFTWYQYKFGLVPKVWDCDSMQTLTRMIGAQSLFGVSDEIPLQWVLAEVLQDDEHSVFILDTAASSQSEVRKAFAKVDAEALYLDGVHIVLVASITKEEETVSKVLPWVDMLNASSSYLFVRNWVTEIEPRAVPIVQGESFAIEQGHYSPPELLQFSTTASSRCIRQFFRTCDRFGGRLLKPSARVRRRRWPSGMRSGIGYGRIFHHDCVMVRFLCQQQWSWMSSTISWMRLLMICCR